MLPLLIDQCYDLHFIEEIEQLLNQNKVAGNVLRFVISEHIPPTEMSFFKNIFYSLNKLGIKIVLDEFGVGYSSLLYMKELPIDQIKISASVLEEKGEKHSADSILKGVISIAKSMGMKTVVVDIENQTQEAFFIEQECDEIQFADQDSFEVYALIKKLTEEKTS